MVDFSGKMTFDKKPKEVTVSQWIFRVDHYRQREEKMQRSWDKAYLACWRSSEEFSVAGVELVRVRMEGEFPAVRRVGRSRRNVQAFAGTLAFTVREMISIGWFCTGQWRDLLFLKRITVVAVLRRNYSYTKMKVKRPLRRLARV